MSSLENYVCETEVREETVQLARVLLLYNAIEANYMRDLKNERRSKSFLKTGRQQKSKTKSIAKLDARIDSNL